MIVCFFFPQLCFVKICEMIFDGKFHVFVKKIFKDKFTTLYHCHIARCESFLVIELRTCCKILVKPYKHHTNHWSTLINKRNKILSIWKKKGKVQLGHLNYVALHYGQRGQLWKIVDQRVILYFLRHFEKKNLDFCFWSFFLSSSSNKAENLT